MNFTTRIVVSGQRRELRWATGRRRDGRATLQIGATTVLISELDTPPPVLLDMFEKELKNVCANNIVEFDARLIHALAYAPIIALCRDPAGLQEETLAIVACYNGTIIDLDQNAFRHEYRQYPLRMLLSGEWPGLKLPV